MSFTKPCSKNSPAQTSSSSNYTPVPSIKEHDTLLNTWNNKKVLLVLIQYVFVSIQSTLQYPSTKTVCKHLWKIWSMTDPTQGFHPRHWKHVGNLPLLQQNVSDSSMEDFWGLEGWRVGGLDVHRKMSPAFLNGNRIYRTGMLRRFFAMRYFEDGQLGPTKSSKCNQDSTGNWYNTEMYFGQQTKCKYTLGN